jgi:long-subunit fatty acid transport protein
MKLCAFKNVVKVAVSMLLVAGPRAFGLGYEKGISLSAKHAGNANAAVASVRGAEGLIFNPAALIKVENDEFVASINAAGASFKAPIADNDSTAEAIATPVAVTYAKQKDGWAYGFGFMVRGGLRIDHGAQELSSSFTLDPEFKSDLTIYEFTPGIAFNLSEKLTFGMQYRITHATAEFSYGTTTGSGLSTRMLEVQWNDLSGTDFNGFQMGFLYEDEGWGLGFNFRNNVTLGLKGTTSGRSELVTAPGTISDLDDGDITVTSSLPLAMQLGGYYDINENSKILFEIGYYQYSVNERLEARGDLKLSGTNVITNITQRSLDAMAYRFGYTHMLGDIPVRAGILMTTAVANVSNPSPVTEAPGSGVSYSLGSSLNLGSGALHYAFDYSYNRADVSDSDLETGASGEGEYDTSAYTLHLAYQMSF